MLLQEPYCSIPSVNNCELIILDPTGNILIYFKVALMVGGILSIPMVTYQLLMFVLPGLTRRERRYVLLSIPATTALFVIGVFLRLAHIDAAGAGLSSASSRRRSSSRNGRRTAIISFVTSLLFWMGVAFQTPLIFFLISLLGLVSARHACQAMADCHCRRFHRCRAYHAHHRPRQYVPGHGAAADALRA